MDNFSKVTEKHRVLSDREARIHREFRNKSGGVIVNPHLRTEKSELEDTSTTIINLLGLLLVFATPIIFGAVVTIFWC